MRTRNRRSRAKSRRSPKFLSLRRHLASPTTPSNHDKISPTTTYPTTGKQNYEAKRTSSSSSTVDENFNAGNVAGAGDVDRDLNVTCLLDGGAGGVGEVPTLDDLLGGTESSGSQSVASSMNWDGGSSGHGGDDSDVLAKRALRGRERWVYCRMTSPSPADEEVASSGAGVGGFDVLCCGVPPVVLSLKLDHDQILSAWSDRGSLYIDGEPPQVVPQIHHTAALPVLVEVECSALISAKMSCDVDRPSVLSRKARVLRYKEKRMKRLFAKRIRYEVRKINAEKRPRWKGRFVKRLDENEDLI